MCKNCLIIDNEDQSSSIEEIIREGKKKNISIKCEQFNVGSPEREDLLDEKGQIDINKVLETFKVEFKGKCFDLIAFDWDLEDEKITGIDLIRQFQINKIRKNTPKFLYSGELKDRIQALFDEFKNDKRTFREAWNWINTLIEAPIEDFKDRDEYEKAIVSLLDKTDPSLESILTKEIRNYPELVFSNTYPSFKGMKLSEIAEIIENDPPRGNPFSKELVEKSVAHMIDLNK